ncbi:MAG: AAA family ATPase [Bacteroidales bacterium]|nr:AAA family ATPase [Bacteroidales bacterium]
MKLNNLIVQAFRGIKTKLEFDLGSALTVLYAPNGTGKTSICEAVEWLFTGQLVRLGIGLADVKDLRCTLSPEDHPTKVEADVAVLGSKFRLIREAGAVYGLRSGERQKLDESELLRLLAPNLVDSNVHGASANPTRRSWLRGSRFLSGESLSLLLESSTDSSDIRQRVFADILGTRSLVDTSLKLTRYCTTIKSKIINAQDEKFSLLQDIQRLIEQLGCAEPNAICPGVEEAIKGAVDGLSDLSKVLVNLHIPDISNSDPADTIEAVRHGLAQANAILGQFSMNIAAVESKWAERNQFNDRVKILSDKLSTLNSKIQTLKVHITDETEKIRTEEQQAASLKNQLDDSICISTRCKQALDQLVNSIQHFPDLSGTANLNMAQLYEAVPEYRLSANEIETRRRLAEHMTSTWQTWRNIPNELMRLKLRQDELTLMISDLGDLTELHSQCERIKEDVRKKRQHYAQITGAVGKLRQAVQSALPSLGKESRCPTCGSIFDTPERLAFALQETMALMPTTYATLAAELSNNEAQLQVLENKIQLAISSMQELEQTRSELINMEAQLLKRKGETAQLGLIWDSNLGTALTQFHAKLSLAEKLKNLLAAVQTLEIVNTKWQSGLETFRMQLLQQTQQMTNGFQGEISEHNRSLASLNKTHSTYSTALKEKVIEQEQTENELAIIREDENSFRSLWEYVAGRDISWSDENLDWVKSLYSKRMALVLQITVQLDTARRIRENKEGSRLIQNRRKRLSVLQEKLEKAQALLDQASRVQTLLEQKITNHTREQIESLKSVVSPLFARMQANRMFDRVETGDNPLDWLGIVEGTSFTPNMHFSQGQRQDLALSIFLARARGLEGTFFLDEPLAHLDDLNRLALLDALRVMVVEGEGVTNMIITTANRALVKHLVQKFARVSLPNDYRALSIYELIGNPRVGVQTNKVV